MRFYHKQRLMESYDVKKDLVYEIFRLAKRLLQNKSSTRGNGVLCQFLCSLYHYKTGVAISPLDYVVHHIDGDHDNNDFSNIALVHSGITPLLGGSGGSQTASHSSIHFQAAKSAISKFCYDNYNLPHNSTLDVRVLNGLTDDQQLEIVMNYINCMITGTERKASRAMSLDIIFVKSFV